MRPPSPFPVPIGMQNFGPHMVEFSQTLTNLKFMKNKKKDVVEKGEKTFSYYACRNMVQVFKGRRKDGAAGPKKDEARNTCPDQK